MGTYTETYQQMDENSVEFIKRMDQQSGTLGHGGDFIARTDWAAREMISEAEGHRHKVMSKGMRKEFLSVAGPALLCMTFIEDALRIPLRWGEQFTYLTAHRGLWAWLAVIALIGAFAVQAVGTALVLRPKKFEPSRVQQGALLLLVYTAIQPFLYAHYDFDFFARAITLSGGLVLLCTGAEERSGVKYNLMSMMSADDATGNASDKLQLCGRLLLTCLFLFQAVHGEQGGLHSVLTSPGVLNVLCFAALVSLCTMVCVGFKTEWSSMLLTLLLAAWAFFIHPFWAFEPHAADFHRYYFFQTLSVIGGLMLLTLHGPGGISLDGTKKSL